MENKIKTIAKKAKAKIAEAGAMIKDAGAAIAEHKKVAIVLLLLVLGLNAASLTGCGDSGTDNPPPPVVEQDKFYDDWVNGITIYKGDVTDQQVEDMIGKFDYNLSVSQKARLANHITEIHVTKNSGQISHEGDVLSVGYNADIIDIKLYLATNGLFAKNQQKDGIMVVKINGTVDAVMSAKLNRLMRLDQMMNEKLA